ncbi:RNA polymerase sigma factor [Patescibacteria group bacterium]|nr:RNA polymerase sigma factor [Patescibacteria group bacterium]MBU1028756.1 RNA polymerase sigma factor [Patescibacteria group bacterium]
MSIRESSDEELVRLVLAKKNEAFVEIQRRFERLLRAQIYRLVQLQESDVEDLLQITYLRMFEQLTKFDPEIAPFKSWLLCLLRNIIFDFLRQRIRRNIVINNCAQAEVCLRSADQEHGKSRIVDIIAARQALDELARRSPDQAEALLQHFVGLTHQEIALAADRPLGTVQARVFRGRKFMKQVLTTDPLPGVES